MKRPIVVLLSISLLALLAPASSLAGLSSTPDSFKTRCNLSGASQTVDPILFQNSAWAEPHAHDFFAAPEVTNNTESAELVGRTIEEGNSTCLSSNFSSEGKTGDEFDGAAYWVPTLHVMKGMEDVAITPEYMSAYYLRVWNTETSEAVQMTHVEDIPDNARIVAGTGNTKMASPSYVSQWICLNDPAPPIQESGLPLCEGSGTIVARINFPYCLSNSVKDWTSWTGKYGGVNAFVKEGEYPEPSTLLTHVAYPQISEGVGTCPTGFDRELPKIFVTVVYPLDGTEAGYAWTDPEGAYVGGGPEGSPEGGMHMPVEYMHADFMNGWVKDDNPPEPSPLHDVSCVKGDNSAVAGCGLTTLIEECVNTKVEGEYAQGEKGTGCGTIISTRP